MTVEISVIVVVSERLDDVEPLFSKYKHALQNSGKTFEFIYVLDGSYPEVSTTLEALQTAGEPIEIIELSKWYGESTALSVGVQRSNGDVILTLPAYAQTELDDLDRLLAELSHADVVLAVRKREKDAFWNRIQARVFHSMLRLISGKEFRDIGCGVRAFRRNVFDDVPVYGDLHRFLPLLAERAGFKVSQLELAQAEVDRNTRIYRPGVYLRRLLDMLTVFFLVKFTKKPLRFFGLLGAGTAGFGAVALFWLMTERIVFSVALGDRPALLLSTLLFSVGIQLIAVGLIGELIIFTHARDMKEYSIERIAESKRPESED